MPRTKARNVKNKRQRNGSAESSIEDGIREMERITEEFENECLLKWQKRKDHINEIFDSYRSRLGSTLLNMTMSEAHFKLTDQTEALYNNNSECKSSKDDGYVTESSSRSSKPKRPVGPLASALAKSRRRSQSATNTSTASGHNTSRVLNRADTTTSLRASRSKFRTPANRLQTMSADRSVMQPVTPKIQMNTPFSMLRYPKIGETIISMSGSPVIANGGAMQGTANINIPISNGIFSMQPTAFSEVDSSLVSRIDDNTLMQLKQLQDNLAVVMNTVSKWNKN